ncbi:MAG: aminotransferase class V-fold PLP-dependent enzyme [Gemmobacter sp.]
MSDRVPDGDDGSGWLLYHSVGQYPGKAHGIARAMAEFAEVWGGFGHDQWGFALGRRAAFLDRWAALIGVSPGTVTATENVTVALHALVTALPAGRLRGRRVLVAEDCFPSLHFLLAGLAPRLGFTLETVRRRQGAHWVEDEDIAAGWGADVGLALLTWISSTSSHRCDIARLAALGRAAGSVVVADITQGAGLLPFDATGCDAVVSTSLKWLCGTPGAGILHVAPALLPDCAPELRGWFSQPDPFSWDLDRFAFAPDIRRFDHGTPAVVGALASLPAMEWHAAQDPHALVAHNRALCADLLDLADALGLPVVSPRDPGTRGGSVMLRLPDHASPARVLDTLRAARLHADARGPVLRLSPGVMTAPAAVARLEQVLAGLLRI